MQRTLVRSDQALMCTERQGEAIHFVEWICERGQRGMAARHSEGGQLVELERVVGDFHRYLGVRLHGDAPTDPESDTLPPERTPTPGRAPVALGPSAGAAEVSHDVSGRKKR